MKNGNRFGIVGILSLYYTFNAVAFIITIIGGTHDTWWLPCFIISTSIGISNTWVLMQLYKRMDVNTATAVALGGGFLLTQIVTALIFASNLSALQYLGLGLIAAGLFAIVKGESKQKESAL